MNLAINKSSEVIRQLNALRKYNWDDAIIAGGAIRDLYFKHPISHFDIFLTAKRLDISVTRDDDFRAFTWAEYWETLFSGHRARYLGNNTRLSNNIWAVWEIDSLMITYRVILIDKPPIQYVNENFDFGVCMAYCDGTKVHFSSGFMNDAMNQTLTLYRKNLTEEQLKYAMGDHLSKLQRKFPGWKLKIKTD
jgi:hypothetical protein